MTQDVKFKFKQPSPACNSKNRQALIYWNLSKATAQETRTKEDIERTIYFVLGSARTAYPRIETKLIELRDRNRKRDD